MYQDWILCFVPSLNKYVWKAFYRPWTVLPTAIYLVTITFLPIILAVQYLLQNVWRKIRQKMTSEFFCQTLGVSTSAAPGFSRCLGQQFSSPLRLTAPTHVLPGGPLKVTSLLAIFWGAGGM